MNYICRHRDGRNRKLLPVTSRYSLLQHSFRAYLRGRSDLYVSQGDEPYWRAQTLCDGNNMCA